MVKGLCLDKDVCTMVFIYTYEDKACLLSDRGYSIPLPDNDHMVWDFNLYSKGFIRYAFGSVDKLAPQNAPQELMCRYKYLPKSISVHNITNDLDALRAYNQNVVYQCHSKVFSSSSVCFGS